MLVGDYMYTHRAQPITAKFKICQARFVTDLSVCSFVGVQNIRHSPAVLHGFTAEGQAAYSCGILTVDSQGFAGCNGKIPSREAFLRHLTLGLDSQLAPCNATG